MPRGLSFLPRRTETGGVGEESLDALYRYLIGNITYTGQGDLTLEKILEPNPRDAIYAPPGEPTLAITKPRFLGRAFAVAPKVWKTMTKGTIPRQYEPTVQGRVIRSTIEAPREYLKSLKRQIRAIPEEAFEGISGVREIAHPTFTAAYSPITRGVKFNPLKTRRLGETAHELAHDAIRYPALRLPEETRKRAIAVEELSSSLRRDRSYARKYYREDPEEITARLMGGIASAWPSKKAIPIKAYDKLFDAALKTALKSTEKRWPGFYREVMEEFPWAKELY